jgi:hypothetical protein
VPAPANPYIADFQLTVPRQTPTFAHEHRKFQLVEAGNVEKKEEFL